MKNFSRAWGKGAALPHAIHLLYEGHRCHANGVDSMDSQSPSRSLLDQALTALRQEKWQHAEELLSIGMTRFPDELDQYGDPVFRKELIRHLVSRQRWDSATALVPTGNGPGKPGWHHILFARALDAIGEKAEAHIHWKAFASAQPRHLEALAALAGISLAEYKARHSRLPSPLKLIREQVPSQELTMIFDVGANEGQSCLPYSRALPDATIHAFEPVPTTFEKLCQNIGEYKNIKAHNIAISSTSGTVQMSATGTSTMNRIEAAPEENRAITVQTQTVRTFCKNNGISHIDFLKIDTEGHDLYVLQGCGEFLQNIDFIQCEASANRYNTFHNAFTDIFDFLSKSGFYLFHIGGLAFEPGNGGYPVLRRFDPVFINARVVGPLRNVRDH